MERLEELRGKRVRSGVVLLLLVTLKADGDDGGCWGELRRAEERRRSTQRVTPLSGWRNEVTAL